MWCIFQVWIIGETKRDLSLSRPKRIPINPGSRIHERDAHFASCIRIRAYARSRTIRRDSYTSQSINIARNRG